jgi:hypothetical protein
MEIQALGRVESGKLIIERRAVFDAHMRELEGKRVRVSVRKYRRNRSLDQNALFHGLICREIAKHTGHSVDEIKEILKFKFARVMGDDGLEYIKPTHLMDTREMSDLCERAVEWAAEFLGLAIDLPDDLRWSVI